MTRLPAPDETNRTGRATPTRKLAVTRLPAPDVMIRTGRATPTRKLAVTRLPAPDVMIRLDGRVIIVTGAGGGIDSGATLNPEIP